MLPPMSSWIEKLMEDEPEPAGALTPSEALLIDRLNTISIWIAREKNRVAVVALVAQEWGTTKQAAERWVAKTEDFLCRGIFEDVQASRALYLRRLEDIHGLAMTHAVKDQVEVTTKPVRLKNDSDGKMVQINGQHTKIKPNALDPNALAIAMKAAREIAHITGARPRDGRMNVGHMNVLVNGAGGIEASAQTTNQLSNESLAQMVGGEVVDESAPGPEVFQDDPADSPEDPPPADDEGADEDETEDP